MYSRSKKILALCQQRNEIRHEKAILPSLLLLKSTSVGEKESNLCPSFSRIAANSHSKVLRNSETVPSSEEQFSILEADLYLTDSSEEYIPHHSDISSILEADLYLTDSSEEYIPHHSNISSILEADLYLTDSSEEYIPHHSDISSNSDISEKNFKEKQISVLTKKQRTGKGEKAKKLCRGRKQKEEEITRKRKRDSQMDSIQN